jgi:hypothetical protein
MFNIKTLRVARIHHHHKKGNEKHTGHEIFALPSKEQTYTQYAVSLHDDVKCELQADS